MIALDTLLAIIGTAAAASPPLLGLFIYAFFKGWIVLGSTHRKAVEEGERWKAMSLRLLGVAEGSLKQARRSVQLPSPLEGDDELDT